MGSVGSYEASIVAVYKRKIKLTKPNSQEDIEKFLKSKGGDFGKVSKEETSLDDIDFSNEEHIGYVYYYDEEECSRYKSEGDIEEYIDEDCEEIYPILKINPEDLKYLDLNILKDMDYYDEDGDFNENITLENIGEYIYCSNDNSSRAKIKIPANILKDLVDKKCTLYLEGDGNGEHC
jgi:hypothetical protein